MVESPCIINSQPSVILHPWIQIPLDHIGLQYILLKEIKCKWTRTVQTYVIQGSSVIVGVTMIVLIAVMAAAAANSKCIHHARHISKCFYVFI